VKSRSRPADRALTANTAGNAVVGARHDPPIDFSHDAVQNNEGQPGKCQTGPVDSHPLIPNP